MRFMRKTESIISIVNSPLSMTMVFYSLGLGIHTA